MEMLLLGLVLAFMLVSFVTELMPVDVTGFVCLALLLLFGLVTPEEATAGFSNPAVVTVMMMFILSEGLVDSGVMRRIGYRIVRLAGKAHRRAEAAVLVLTGVASAFLNNTAAVSAFMPLSLQLAKHYCLSPSKLLIPLSYSAIFGGTCTLIGTSTNILVSALAVGHGLAPFSVFEFFYLGGIIFAGGLAYNLWIAPRLLPERASQESLTVKYEMGSYLTELKVAAKSELVGKTVLDEDFAGRSRVNVLEILRESQRITSDIRHTVLEAGDLLIVRGPMEDILAFKEERGLLLLTDVKLDDTELSDENNILVEMQLSPGSELVGATVREIDFRKRFGCFVLALARLEGIVREKITSVPLQPWDTLLVFGPRQRVVGAAATADFIPLQELAVKLRLSRRWWIGALAIPLVVLLAAFEVMPILKSALIGVALLLVTRTVRIQQAYRSIDWSVIFLLATILPLGTALEEQGLARWFGERILAFGEPFGAFAVLSLMILATSILTEVVSNNSAAVLMVPIAMSVAHGLGVDPKPFLMGIAFAASMSFATPTGYQTNTMVYAPGGYRFLDYLKVGVPLNVILWVVASLLVPRIWPFVPV